jgi:hypothetical protein
VSLLAVNSSCGRQVETSHRLKRDIAWNGNNWAFACDFTNNDLSNVQIPGADCSGRCAQTSGCTHFTWTTYNGGTCWMKYGSVSQSDAFFTNDYSMVCGVLYTTIPILPATNSTKRGLCWPWNNPPSSFALFSPNAIPWLYNWELWDPRANGAYSTAEYVPMSRTQADASQVPGYFTNCYAQHFLGFNEPDLPASQNGNYISPYDASVLWKQYIQPVKQSCSTSLGAPAVTNGVGSGLGTDWLGQFFGNCTSPSCSFDFIPLHWYGTSLSDFQAYVTQFHSLFPTYPLWITEWQFTGVTSTETASLEKQALQWLDAQSYVARYAMFGPMNAANMAGIVNGAMVTDDLSALTNVGKIYAGLM